jgi:hypothetical protein
MVELERSNARAVVYLWVLLVGGVSGAFGTEVTVRNDSLVEGELGMIQTGFVAGESAAVWLNSPCDGNIVAVQVYWRSVTGTAPQSLEDSISIFESGAFPVPGTLLEIIEGPVMTDSVINEFRYLDENQTIPLIVPVTTGQGFVVSFKFLNGPDPVSGPSVVTDADGCQAGKNTIDEITIGWIDVCLLGVSGDWVIRAVVDCGALPGACCQVGGTCADGLTEPQCSSAGGAFQGEGTECGSITCTEACCFLPSGCLDLTVSDCGIAGGFNQGPGTDCASTECFPAGACCNPDGSCTDDVPETDCTAGGGAFQGNDSLCSQVTCPQPEGACCLPGDNCLVLTAQDCEVIPQSWWAGPLTDCEDSDQNEIADDCEVPAVSPPGAEPGGPTCGDPVDCMGCWLWADCVGGRCYVPKNRYLSIDPTVNVQPVAFRVEVTQAMDYPTAVGRTWWVDEPACYDYPNGEPVIPPPASCEEPDYFGWVSHLSDSPVQRLWSEVPLHITDCGIVPVVSYAIRASANGGGSFSDPLIINTIHHPLGDTQHWGDVTAGPCPSDAGIWLPPERSTNLGDVGSAIRTFENRSEDTGFPPRVWVDVEINHVINFGDIQFLVNAFEGVEYADLSDLPFIGVHPVDCP